ncbi:TIR domain-containing protein [Lentzea sp. NBRC 102530]|uniref:TIR domain-containing protein n=1 Tax=Lentzea sp. NBRC 102530 TaxID=3032201 RepID=UPI0024A21A5E|nr:TIR domain-containing protein [Lentzea sp. NBRC 102530]GLY49064.1 hypothetical protein Lesp01_27200 [Lentzea sp. NBRC 102530]
MVGPALEFEYDVVLSFAGEQREFVESVAGALRDSKVRVFYDAFEEIELWGKDLHEHLAWVYSKAARHCVLFSSFEYHEKLWTNHERKSAQVRAFREHEADYVLPVRLDDAEITGHFAAVGHIDARVGDDGVRRRTPREIADLIVKKLPPKVLPARKSYIPAEPDELYRALDATKKAHKVAVKSVAGTFLGTLERMSVEERRLVLRVFRDGCQCELPSNVHVFLDMIRRDFGYQPETTMDMLYGLTSLGFTVQLKERSRERGGNLVALGWRDRHAYQDSTVYDYVMRNSLAIAMSMLELSQSKFCAHHGDKVMEDLDFVGLATDVPMAELERIAGVS